MKPYRFGFKAVLIRGFSFDGWSLVLASPLSSEICLFLSLATSAPDQSTIIVKARLEIKD
jgi:hypothetical protein